ncbi:hypothetical protein ACF07Y_45965 [Streptomyces sp. NPDC016566]|uniref:hypothetical protein n=1 Tax=Streptomyces sp. NPDC016566 TaxID=3364967 RepID=UPI0037004D4C
MDAVNPARYHLTLTSAGRAMMHGWWGSETTARGQFSTWVGERGTMPGARITLTDEEPGTVLITWPDEP